MQFFSKWKMQDTLNLWVNIYFFFYRMTATGMLLGQCKQYGTHIYSTSLSFSLITLIAKIDVMALQIHNIRAVPKGRHNRKHTLIE